jgi:gas vesicle protein
LDYYGAFRRQMGAFLTLEAEKRTLDSIGFVVTDEVKTVSREADDGILTLLAGMALGMIGGGLMGILLAPKSGDELRADANAFVRSLPNRVNDEFRNPNTKTREFIEKTRYSIESQVGKVKKDRDAGRMAKAKEAEELATGYDYN